MKYEKWYHHPLYKVWQNIKTRIYNKGNHDYEYYGSRGIAMYENWVNDPRTFISWPLGNGWEKGLKIDRIDNDGNYCPDNCRFVTPQISSCNTRLLPKDNKSGYRGVYYYKSTKRWKAQITIKNKKLHLGYFHSPRLAAIAYDVKAYSLNDCRPTNFF